jgi:hypothetical protein
MWKKCAAACCFTARDVPRMLRNDVKILLQMKGGPRNDALDLTPPVFARVYDGLGGA